MGTIIGTLTWPVLKMDGFFGEGFVTDPARVAERIAALKKKRLSLPSSAATYAKHVAALPAELYLLAGSTDAVTTSKDSKALATAKRGRICQEFNGGHGGGWNALEPGNGYVQALVLFTQGLKK
jgi:hypothetical protein